MNQIIHQAFLDELEKISAARWSTYLRGVKDPVKAKRFVDEMYRLNGVRPPARSVESYRSPELRERMIIDIRREGKLVEPDLIPRGSPLWRSAMQDIRHGRTARFESGTSRKAAENIMKRGPSGQIGLPLERSTPGMAKAVDDLYDNTSRSRWRDVSDRLKHGLYAADAGTTRTGDYARRASDWDQSPGAVVSFDLPRSLAISGSNQELRVPRQVFNRWARNKRIKNQ